MKILFVLWHPEYTVRLCESVLDALLLRGHQLHLGFTATSADEPEQAAGPNLVLFRQRGVG